MEEGGVDIKADKGTLWRDGVLYLDCGRSYMEFYMYLSNSLNSTLE